MAGWTYHTGTLVHLAQDNVDTDQLIPARFMSVPRAQGYGPYLLHDIRRDATGGLRPDFALNAVPEASVLIAGRNFGSGSSREAAVYALVDAGFRAVFAPGFGDIFASNAVNNGLLPAVLSAPDCAAAAAAGRQAEVDLSTGTLRVGTATFGFEISDVWRQKLINGWDDIDLTRARIEAIDRFRQQRAAVPGAWPRPPEGTMRKT